MLCNFKAKKLNIRCTAPATNVGESTRFCKRHSTTVQAKQTKPIEVVNILGVTIKRNKHGNFAHTTNNIVFDMKTRKAYGHQLENGEVCELSDEEMALCRDKGWSYQVKKKIESNLIF